MQVFKRVKKAQNLVEFMLIFPILLVVTLVILEVALYWQDVNAVYNLNSEINANIALIEQKKADLGETSCTAAESAIKYIVDNKQQLISMKALTVDDFTKNILDGNEPFALYEYRSATEIAEKPLITLWVDCRNPYEEGYTTYIEFYHKTLIISASIPTLGGEPIVVIPKNIYIASPKENTLRHY